MQKLGQNWVCSSPVKAHYSMLTWNMGLVWPRCTIKQSHKTYITFLPTNQRSNTVFITHYVRYCFHRTLKPFFVKPIDGLVQERRNSIALAMELRLSCTSPSLCPSKHAIMCRKSAGIGPQISQQWLNSGSSLTHHLMFAKLHKFSKI